MTGKPTNRIDDLRRPSKEYPRSFVPDNLDVLDWDSVQPLVEDILDRSLNSPEAIEGWLTEASELMCVISEEGSRRRIAMTCATDDEEARDAHMQFVENIVPRLKPISDQVNRKFIASPCIRELDSYRYEVLTRTAHNSIALYSEDNIPLETELERLGQQYRQITGSITVEYRGQEYTAMQMMKFMLDPDREVREKAWVLMNERMIQDTERIDGIFDRMLQIRHQIAGNVGFDDFREYIFLRRERFDYTPEDCLRFHDSIEKRVVPVTRRMLEERRESLKIDTVRPWDKACDRFERPPLIPFDSVEQLSRGCREIIGRIDAGLGNQFQRMIELGLLDLSSRKGKAPGGYQAALTEARLPFIFMNAVGLTRDVFVLLHEAGHAFHQFAVRDENFINYRHAPTEFSEVASMSMELLGGAHLDVFFDTPDAARAWRNKLEGDLHSLPGTAVVDAFQHWIYTNPGHSSDERASKWLDLVERFGTGLNWTGYEHFLKYSWHQVLHIFLKPFYYIEYAIAELGALQVWRNSRENFPEAISAYKRGLSLGGSRPLPELFETAGIKFDFSERILEQLMQDAQTESVRFGKLERF